MFLNYGAGIIQRFTFFFIIVEALKCTYSLISIRKLGYFYPSGGFFLIYAVRLGLKTKQIYAPTYHRQANQPSTHLPPMTPCRGDIRPSISSDKQLHIRHTL